MSAPAAPHCYGPLRELLVRSVTSQVVGIDAGARPFAEGLELRRLLLGQLPMLTIAKEPIKNRSDLLTVVAFASTLANHFVQFQRLQ